MLSYIRNPKPLLLHEAHLRYNYCVSFCLISFAGSALFAPPARPSRAARLGQSNINNLHRSRYQLWSLLDNRKGVQQMTKTYSETINVKRIVLLKALNCSSSGMPKYRIIAEVDDGSFMELETATNSIIAYEVTNRRYKENLVISFHVTKSGKCIIDEISNELNLRSA